MSIKYKAKFTYAVRKDSKVALLREDVSIDSFEVSGGAYRYIDIRSTNDISVSSELEQARTFKNITLYIPPTKDGSDMETALELTNIARTTGIIQSLASSRLIVIFTIRRYLGRKMLEGLVLRDNEASLTIPPYIVGNHLLKVDISIPTAKLYRGKFQGRYLLNQVEM